jgi:hypothetical protein
MGIGIEFDDTHRLFGVPRSGLGLEPDILGAMFFEAKDPTQAALFGGSAAPSIVCRSSQAKERVEWSAESSSL